MIALEEALKIATDYLNDKELNIVSYKDMDDSYVFQYEYNNKPLFDNAMIEVNKKSGVPTTYIISKNLSKLKKYKNTKV